MPLVIKDRIREESTSIGSGTFTLAGAVTGFRPFSDIGDGNTTYYTIALQGTNEWEVGIGTYTASGTTLSRDTVLSNSFGTTTQVNFSAGIKDVFVTYPASNAVITDLDQTLSNKTITQRVNSTTSISSPLVWNSNNFDIYAATAQAGSFTINADAGTPTDGRKIVFRFASDATPGRIVTFTGGASKAFKPVGVSLTISGSNFTYTLVANRTTYIGCYYNNASDRWEIVALTQET